MATPSVREHLLSLEGRAIRTITGFDNEIIRVDDSSVVVGTRRSAEGYPVAISAVQDAVDRVFAGQEVPIHPTSVGYRSAFIGAVLQSLPGVESSAARFAPDCPNVRCGWPATTWLGSCRPRALNFAIPRNRLVARFG